MKQKHMLWLGGLMILGFGLACNLVAVTATPKAIPTVGQIPSNTERSAPPSTPTPEKPTDTPEPSSTATPTATSTVAFTGAKPGDPPATIWQLDDPVEKDKPDLGYANAGDNFAENIFERPFKLDMTYRPDLDIWKAYLAKDATWFYATIILAGPNAGGKYTADYGVELDVNLDGRGEYVIWANPDYSTEWTRANIKIFGTSTHLVGGPHPTLSDAPWTGLTYDKTLFQGSTDFTNNGAWVRISPSSDTKIELAFNTSLVGSPSQFVWGIWADDGIKDPTKFDYNDQFTKAQAGSAFKNDPDFPPKAIFSMDNTCRAWFGFTPTVAIPGSCFIPPPPTLTRTPTKMIPTKTYTDTIPIPG
jgi:hypothetical protein